MQKVRTWRDFWSGLSIGCLVVAGLNALPYLYTRNAPVTCGIQSVGSPFVFRSFGGFSGQIKFYWEALVADIVVAVLFAVAFGLLKRRFGWISFLVLTVGAVVVASLVVAYRRATSMLPWFESGWPIVFSDVAIWLAVVVLCVLAAERVVRSVHFPRT